MPGRLVNFWDRKGYVCAWIISVLVHSIFISWPLGNGELQGAERFVAVRGMSVVTARLSGVSRMSDVSETLSDDTAAVPVAVSDLSDDFRIKEEAQAALVALAESSPDAGLMEVPFAPIPASVAEIQEPPKFYLRSELSAPPVMVLGPDLDEVMASDQEARVIGVYRFRLYVSKVGEVVRVQNVSGEGRLNESIAAALMKARFSPARLDGVVVNSQVEVALEIVESAQGASQVSDHGVRLPPLPG